MKAIIAGGYQSTDTLFVKKESYLRFLFWF